MTTLFVQSLKDATYYERMISAIGLSFSEVIRMGDFIEEGIVTRRITNFVALQATSETIQSDSFEGARKRKRDGVSSVVTVRKHRPNQMSTYQMPSPRPPYYNQNNQSPHPSYYYPYTQSPQILTINTHLVPTLSTIPIQYIARLERCLSESPQYQPAYLPLIHKSIHQMHLDSARKYERKPAKTYTPLAEPRAQLYERLKTAGILQPIPGNIPNPIPRSYDETKHCAYHSGIPGHDTENCYALRDKIEALIKEGVIQLKGPSSNVNDNPLPNHDDANVNMITVDEEHNLEGTIVPIQIEEKVESSAFVTPMITVQVRAPFGVEVFPPKSQVMASSFLGKVLSTNLRRKGDASLPKSCSTSGHHSSKHAPLRNQRRTMQPTS
ncbi:hypothetical protein K7X08_023392 [Anisodus acutangulus]|uniref:Uncharacterized protein n=1 Tax=Anisodus acutangulus TaxID=402998 RepID=A0A9Q1LER8_9SOLA|nr:hypothetical protein K7X08_023392 [Anisodus acutangulus]